jgi:hypothetical protein
VRRSIAHSSVDRDRESCGVLSPPCDVVRGTTNQPFLRRVIDRSSIFFVGECNGSIPSTFAGFYHAIRHLWSEQERERELWREMREIERDLSEMREIERELSQYDSYSGTNNMHVHRRRGTVVCLLLAFSMQISLIRLNSQHNPQAAVSNQ